MRALRYTTVRINHAMRDVRAGTKFFQVLRACAALKSEFISRIPKAGIACPDDSTDQRNAGW
jgi:hypothetical protein